MTPSALSASVVAAIDDLEVAARLIVEGLRTGANRSPFHGFSTEFRQHRAYRAGDDLKYLDWKLFGRSDRLYTRQFLETTNLSMMLVLDTSASMAFPATGVAKFRYSQLIAAALAYLAITQGNAVGLMSMQRGSLVYLPARGGRPHLRALIAQIDQLAPDTTWDGPRTIARAAQLLARRGLLATISDFYDAEDATRRELRQAVRRGHDVAMLQLISRDERDLPYDGAVEFADLESGARRILDARAAAPVYRAAVSAFLERCRTAALRDGIDYALIGVDTPPETALRHYLLARRGSGAGVPTGVGA